MQRRASRLLVLASATTSGLLLCATASGATIWTQQVSGTSQGATKSLGQPSNLVATGGAGQVTLTWNAETSSGIVNGYKLLRYTTATGGTGVAVCPSALQTALTGCTDSGLSAGTYYYSIASVYRASGSTVTWTGTESATRASATVVAALTVSTPDLAAGSDSGTSNTDNLTNVTTPTFTGTGTVGATVTLFDGSTSVGSGTVSAGGTWSITSSTLTGGAGTAHTMTASATLASSTVSSPGSLVVTIDTQAPTVTGLSSTVTGSTAGRAESGDTIVATWSEPVNGVSTGSQTMTVCAQNACSPNPGGGNSKITVPGLTSVGSGSTGIAANTGYAANGNTFTSAGSTSASADRRTFTYTLGTMSGTVSTATSTVTHTFNPATAITDDAGNTAASSTIAGVKLF